MVGGPVGPVVSGRMRRVDQRLRGRRRLPGMCRSIKTLRPPYAEHVTDADIHAAALQYVRKISGFRAPAGHNADAFTAAVEEITAASTRLLAAREVRGTTRPAERQAG